MHFLAAAAVMEKRYSGAYFTGPVRATHAPPQSNREHHSRRFFHGPGCEIDCDKISKTSTVWTRSQYSGFLSFIYLFSQNPIKPCDIKHGVSLKVVQSLRSDSRRFM